MIIGYTTGVWDMFHVGHLRMLKRVRGLCDLMIVGVSTDELIKKEKGKKPIVPFEDRREIIDGLGWVDSVIPQYNLDKFKAWEKLKYDLLFVGEDHYGEPKWKEYEDMLDVMGIKVIYLPYTKRTSSTILRKKCHDTI